MIYAFACRYCIVLSGRDVHLQKIRHMVLLTHGVGDALADKLHALFQWWLGCRAEVCHRGLTVRLSELDPCSTAVFFVVEGRSWSAVLLSSCIFVDRCWWFCR